MSLVPRGLRPTTLLRRRMTRSGLTSESDAFRLVAMLMVGGSALARSTAIRNGLLGRGRFWQVVALGFVANDVRRKLTEKQPEHLGVERLAVGQSVVVTALPASERRSRRAS